MTKILLADGEKLIDLASDLGEARPLGSALVVRLSGSPLADLSIALQEHTRSPWCPLVLAGNAPPDPGMLSALGLHGHRIGSIDLCADHAEPSIGDVRVAISQRGAPDLESFRSYVAARSSAAVAAAVGEAVDGSCEWSSGLRRRLGRLGMPSPQHWFNLFWLTTYLCMAKQEGGMTLEQVALDCGRAPRTLSCWCARYLRCSWPEARRRLGWEWGLESMIAGSEIVNAPKSPSARTPDAHP